MKKYLLFISMFIIFPAWALCPVGDGESVCSLSGTSPSSSGMPLFQQNNSETNLNENLNNSFGKTQNHDGVQMQGSLGCQFGNCNKGANNDFLENQ